MMPDVINLKGYRSILCLNGDLPKPDFFIARNLPIIAADGAANRLLELNVHPQLIIGDLDSIHTPILESYPYLHLPDQASSDYQKAMQYLSDNNLLPAIIVGVNGGFLDHILNNINIFMATDCLLYSPPIRGFVLKEQSSQNFLLPVHTKISLIGMPTAILSSHGLQWELQDTHLSFPGTTSCFNRTRLSEVILEAHQGAVLVLIYEQMIKDAGVLKESLQ
ncbi:putative thiamin pyrophosphokinase [Legionella longbeachae NSW150]|uniref:Thiamine diphosphokinase n=2 Tax=Legionella longbeachae TaxID=450 RepID=D3HM75_LEGLN|nr:putative thiamin pyrophosphokinase [Legionella longbeachae NSW150]